MRIAYRIMASPERKAFVEAELQKLSGCDVKVFYDDRPDPERIGTSYTQLKCVNDALAGDYTHLCILQDDLLLVNDFDKCIKELVNARPMALWTLFCPRIRDMSFNAPYARLFPANTWGPGNVIPIGMLKKIMAFREERLPNYIYDDGLYLMYCIENGIPTYTTRVALLQHLCPEDSLLGYNSSRKVSKIWAGEDVYGRIKWQNRIPKSYNIPTSANIPEEYAKYGPKPKQAAKIRYIMRTVGNVDLHEYTEAIPTLEIARDRIHNAMDTFKLSLEMAGDDPCVHLEDDIILCDDFVRRVEAEIAKRPNDVIQFFSMRKDDLTVGSRYIRGGAFCMNQCYYIPPGMGTKLLAYMDVWDRYDEHPTGYDILMADFFKLNGIKYWNVCPNLVDHKVAKSRINARRSSKRQSFTFEK